MNIEESKVDIALRTNKGVSFILASVILWIGIFVVWTLPIENVLTRNLFTFFCTAPLMPLAFFISKMIKAEFSIKDNRLNNLGILFSANQLVYILIAMWAYSQAPYSMVMIIAIIFGAHLMPFSWLYKSRAYFFMSIFIPLVALTIGATVGDERVYLIPLFMIVVEIIFSIWLYMETKALKNT